LQDVVNKEALMARKVSTKKSAKPAKKAAAKKPVKKGATNPAAVAKEKLEKAEAKVTKLEEQRDKAKARVADLMEKLKVARKVLTAARREAK